jgi:hypothetical protein
MKHIDSFKIYLTTRYRSRNGTAFISKVASDFASRLRRLDSLLGQPLDDKKILKDRDFEGVVSEIKSHMLAEKTHETKMRYPYQTYINALLRYREYLSMGKH